MYETQNTKARHKGIHTVWFHLHEMEIQEEKWDTDCRGKNFLVNLSVLNFKMMVTQEQTTIKTHWTEHNYLCILLVMYIFKISMKGFHHLFHCPPLRAVSAYRCYDIFLTCGNLLRLSLYIRSLYNSYERVFFHIFSEVSLCHTSNFLQYFILKGELDNQTSTLASWLTSIQFQSITDVGMVPGWALCQSNNSSPFQEQISFLSSKSSKWREWHLEIHYNAMCLAPLDDGCRHCKQRTAVPALWETAEYSKSTICNMEKALKVRRESSRVANGGK